MKLDKKRVEDILSKKYSFYDKGGVSYMLDARLSVNLSHFIKNTFKSHYKVLDIGCGNGHSLLDAAENFESAIGIDNKEEHIRLSKERKKELNIKNVTFDLISAEEMPFDDMSFHFILSERGPLFKNEKILKEACRVLKKHSLIFAEIIGELDAQEASEIFHRGKKFRKYQHSSAQEQAKVMFIKNKIEIRIMNNQVTKMTFEDIYEWLKYHCSVQEVYGRKSLSMEDFNKIQEFYDLNKTKRNEIVVTNHKVWIGGIKNGD